MAIKKRSILVWICALTTAAVWVGGISPAIRAADGKGSGTETTPSRQKNEIPQVVFNPRLHGLVDHDRNIIIDETGNLASFIEKLQALRSGVYNGSVNIVHVGDSHVQAGFWDGRMRDHFARDFGCGGRGSILPHRLTGTNEPSDYYIRTTNSYKGFRVTSNDSRQKLSYTGTGILFDYGYPRVEIWARDGFDAVTVIHHPDAAPLGPDASLLLDTQCVMGDTEENTTYYLSRRVDTLVLEAKYVPGVDSPLPLYYGFILHGGSGVTYHSIGANGAAFEHFERYTTIPEGGAGQLFPDLIIVSLGTNNCYGRNYRSDNLTKVVERFFDSIEENYRGVPVLVTTPRESGQRASGSKYAPNPNIEDAAAVIRQAASRYGFATWDFYSAAGGKGIIEKWFEMKLSGRDRIHLTEEGYRLVGDMMYDALIKYYNCFTPPAAISAEIKYKGRDNTNHNTAFLKFAAMDITTAVSSPG
ncbi:MAG: GDSL-type esterase/lipase family protein [Rikenellaceae bacterium]|nr:GDSL-type esterase/lipase family protein [Rikenellaceae bacterium]